MIAAELAAALGAATSRLDVATSPTRSHARAAGLRRASPRRRSTPRAPTTASVPIGRRPCGPPRGEPIDPMAFPGVESVERQGAPTAGRSRLGLAPDLLASAGARPAVPPTRADVPAAGTPAPRAAGRHYSLRLVAPRRLYDRGPPVTALAVAPRRWSTRAALRANPYDLDRLGAAHGRTGPGPLRHAARGRCRRWPTLHSPRRRGHRLQRPGPGVDGPTPRPTLIDALDPPVTDVRLESL